MASSVVVRTLPRLLHLGFFVGLVAPATGQEFGPKQFVAGQANGVSGVAVADVDGDGDEDVVSSSFADDKLAWYENTDGLGSMGAQRVITTEAGGAAEVFAADLDGDGDVDVLAASQSDDTVAWYANVDGLGSFGPAQVLTSTEPSANDVHAADLDGDGDLDALSISFSDGRISWYANLDGLGGYGPPQVVVSSLFSPEDMETADVDGDGDTDVLSASSIDDLVAWYENADGLGGFGARQVVANLPGARAVDTADFDGDGDTDVVAAGQRFSLFGKEPNETSWFENTDGAGAFAHAATLTTTANGSRSVLATDVNGDGDQDVLLCVDPPSTAPGPGLLLFENLNGMGTFSAGQSVAALDMVSVVAADLDGDGDGDLAGIGAAGELLWFANSDGLGAFQVEETFASLVDYAQFVGTADFDGDGDEDVLAASGLITEGFLLWFRNTDGAGLFDLGGTLDVASFGGTGRDASDVDGDGDLDVVAAMGGVKWYENTDGLGTFGPGTRFTLVSAWALEMADLDGDGDPDALATHNSLDEVYWHANTDGLGTFGPQQTISAAVDFASDAHAADLDNDGDLDVLSASGIDDEIVWFANTDGLGSFGPKQVVAALVEDPQDVHAADLDGDGDLDALAALTFGDEITWHENTDGLGTFGAKQSVLSPFVFARGVHAEDLDGDGDADVLAAAQINRAVWSENTDGLGTFGPEKPFASDMPGCYDVTPADLNGDGKPEVLAASRDDDTVAWFENLTCSAAVGSVEAVRVGSPPNPAAFLPGVTSGPVIGETWDPVVDHTVFAPQAQLDFVGVTPTATNLLIPGMGTLLCDVSVSPLVFTQPAGQPFAIAIPYDCVFAGATLCSQAVSAGEGLVELTNALDLTVGTF